MLLSDPIPESDLLAAALQFTNRLLVTIEEAPPTTVGYGGGVEGRLRVVDNGVGTPAKMPVEPDLSSSVPDMLLST